MEDTDAAPTMFEDLWPRDLGAGIGRLKQRIDDLLSAQERGEAFTDARLACAERNVRDTVLTILDQVPGSAPAALPSGPSGAPAPISAEQRQAWFLAGIRDTLTLLDGLVSHLQEGRRLPQPSAAAPAPGLHPRIAEACAAALEGERHDEAVVQGSRALLYYLREKTGRHGIEPSRLMRETFREEQSDALRFLFEGAVLAADDERLRARFGRDRRSALEFLGLASLLARSLSTRPAPESRLI